jgi:hypothetical protein
LLNTSGINHDKQLRIPFIKQAFAAARGKLNPAFNLRKKKMKAGEQIEESVTITNIGKYDGEEIV